MQLGAIVVAGMNNEFTDFIARACANFNHPSIGLSRTSGEADICRVNERAFAELPRCVKS